MQAREDSKVTLDILKAHILALRQDFSWDNILNIYQWGSRVYGTATPQSDYDFVFVLKDIGPPRPPHLKENLFDIENDTFVVLEDELVNATLIPLADWRLLLAEHRHEALECHFSPPWARWLERYPVPWCLDSGVLRRTVSWEARARLRTALNKLKAGDTYRGKKEIVHQLRYRMFALQILRTGRITDYACANEVYGEILADESTDFQHYREVGEQRADQLKQQLREEFGDHPQFYNEIETERKIWTWMEMAAKRQHFRLGHGFNWVGDCGVLPRYGLTSGHATLCLPRPGSEAISDQAPNPNQYCFFHLPRYTDMDCPITDKVTICEFIDGLECFLYWRETAWVLGTEWLPSRADYLVSWKQGSSTSSTATWYSHLTQRTLDRLFWDIWQAGGYAFPSDTSLVYVFRIASEKHRRVTRYDDRLYLVYATDGATYFDPEPLGKQLGYFVPQRYPAIAAEDLQRLCSEQSPFVFAGYRLRALTVQPRKLWEPVTSGARSLTGLRYDQPRDTTRHYCLL